MMLKEKSSKWAYAKCLYALPLAFAVASAYAVPTVSEQFNKVENTAKTIQKDTTKGGTAMVIKGKVGEGNRSSSDTIIIKGGRRGLVQEAVQPLYIVDDKEIDATSFRKIRPKDIAHIAVLNDKSATQIYGEKGKGGVVINTTKVGEKKGTNTLRSQECADLEDEKEKKVLSSYKTGGSLLLVLDGKEMDIINGKDLDKYIDQNNIASISVLKGNVAIKHYGDKGKDGVISITTKNKNKKK
ncbi:MAG: hypothetical protein RR555_11065 [Bacteroidales bacterium]